MSYSFDEFVWRSHTERARLDSDEDPIENGESAANRFEEFKTKNGKVDFHRGCNEEWLERHQTICKRSAEYDKPGRIEIAKYLYQRIRDERNLILAVEHVGKNGGETPGPDGMTYQEIEQDRYKFARDLRDAIDDGHYRHGPIRMIHIPKGPGRGTRPVRLMNIWDRTVHRGILQGIGPFLDPSFHLHSFGGRPNRDRLHALALAECFFRCGKRICLSVDIADAFEGVPQQRLLDLLKNRIPVRPHEEVKRRAMNAPIRENLYSLMRKIIVTPEGKGLRQGAATSPIFLNLFADHHIDRTWAKLSSDVPLIRYVDDMLLPCTSVASAEDSRRELERLLSPTGMRLKKATGRESGVYDLENGDLLNWLGYEISWNRNGMVILPPAAAWEKTRDIFEREAKFPHADQDIDRLVMGWAQRWGPAYPHADRAKSYQRLANLARSSRLSEFPAYAEFVSHWERAYMGWLDVRNGIRAAYESNAAAFG